MSQNLEKNKQNAVAFYRMAYLGEPAKAVTQFVGDNYIQHNPAVGDGKQPSLITSTRCIETTPTKVLSS